MSSRKKEVLNVVFSDRCPDDMESWDGLVSFDVDDCVLDAKEAFRDAISEYVTEQKKTIPLEDDEEATVTWDKIYSHMPDELFEKHGLHRRHDVTNYLVFVDCDDEPEIEED